MRLTCFTSHYSLPAQIKPAAFKRVTNIIMGNVNDEVNAAVLRDPVGTFFDGVMVMTEAVNSTNEKEAKMTRLVCIFKKNSLEWGGIATCLAEITSIGLPVPAGFTITTEVCTEFYKNDRNYPTGLEDQANKHWAKIEQYAGIREILGKHYQDMQDIEFTFVKTTCHEEG